MTIATWNVNGIRARATAFERWLRAHRPDILCLQEIKAHPDQIPEGVREIPGYASRWHGARGGYSGVSIHMREALRPAEYAVPRFDQETRAYSWWPYYGGARARNAGWRIDYILAPESLAKRSGDCWIEREESSSDHSPVLARFGEAKARRGSR